ncbi:N-6 DNA methylase [Hymenobacter volaticus]|uniref:SAM-dependent methyltransferase n=1 Tax=Hymenobacter volaticus TaxID=2932254 RepID=A0ABY4GGB8_9BACT|nr:N-6 DNA methylase [Hymenobacter volaticus]UOQ69881.1 SAM-dependent methyltransferase [Hymenobacter volaticus]
MKDYTPFLIRLKEVLKSFYIKDRITSSELENEVKLLLDGEAGRELRKHVTLEERKEASAFFTGSELSERLAGFLKDNIEKGESVLDPACGAGNLLIACARCMPVLPLLSETIKHWNSRLFAYDVHKEFVEATKCRLAILALERGAQPDIIPEYALLLFTNIYQRDALDNVPWHHTDCLIINPPFGPYDASLDCTWSTGKVSLASLFIERAIKEGIKVIACILPDVLRTGVRYSRWRGLVESCAPIQHIESIGRFDSWADVDVFLVVFTNARYFKINPNYIADIKSVAWWPFHNQEPWELGKLEEAFRIRVGSVVPHRNPLVGFPNASAPAKPYIDAFTCPPWGRMVIDSFTSVRKYGGTCYTPPFLVVRRTSSPSDARRLVATIIEATDEIEDVAVENHLIVIQPLNGSLESCLRLQAQCNTSTTDTWLNERIRCRHLTVASLRELPIQIG